MIKIAIIDDDVTYIQLLESHIMRYQVDYSTDIQLSTFTNGLNFMMEYQPIYDILFIDIRLRGVNGLEIAASIRKQDPAVIIVFATNMEQFAINGYEVNAFDYLVKPIDYALFQIRLSFAIQASKNSHAQELLFLQDNVAYRENVNEIIYIEVEDHWLTVHAKNKTYRMLETLKNIEGKLDGTHFIRCSKRILVNLGYITRIRGNCITLYGGTEIDTSRTKRKEILDAFMKYHDSHI